MSVGILLTARLKSSRLARKVEKPILGKPMLAHLIDRLKLANTPDRIVLCTSTVEQDDPLVDIAEQAGIDFFRGHPDDVLVRIRDAAREFAFDTIVVCTGDNPFIDPPHIDALVHFARVNKLDYAITADLPLGVTAYVLNAAAVERACQIKEDVDTEFWPEYFTESGIFRFAEMPPLATYFARSDLRLTVDYQEDFDLVSALFDALGVDGNTFSLAAIIAYLDGNPKVRTLNANVRQAARKRPTLKPRADWQQVLKEAAG